MDSLKEMVGAVAKGVTLGSSTHRDDRWPKPADGISLKNRIVELWATCKDRTDDDDVVKLAACLDVLAHIPAWWAHKAIRSMLVDVSANPQHPWRPTPQQIVAHASALFRRERLRATGETGYNPRTGQSKLSIPREVGLMARGAEANGMLEYAAKQMLESQLKRLEANESPVSGR